MLKQNPENNCSSKITPIDQHLAKKLRQFRTTVGLTQEKLGELCGITFQQVQKYEKAQNRISASKLFEIAQLLNKPISEFFADFKDDSAYFNYEIKDQKQAFWQDNRTRKEILTLTKAYMSIDCSLVKKNAISLLKSMSGSIKKTKHSYN